MRCFKLTIAYDGTAYVGWQVQPNQPTVQGAVEQAWQEITGETVHLSASGRTDAGVHAEGQVAGVVTATAFDAGQLRRAINARLPDDIRIIHTEVVAQGFHATHDAARKWYQYRIDNQSFADVFRRRYAWHIPQALNVAAMHRAGQALVGQHDFSSFASSGSPRESNVRTIFRLHVARAKGPHDPRVMVDVVGDGFLYNMVRAIAGSLVDVGKGARDEISIHEMLQAKDRSAAGRTAPPHGLFLMSVDYEERGQGSC